MLKGEKASLKTWVSSGELWIWVNAAAVGISIAAVGGLLALIAAPLLFVGGLLAKEMVITLPAVVLLIDLLARAPIGV